jgi:hypothetical protein
VTGYWICVLKFELQCWHREGLVVYEYLIDIEINSMVLLNKFGKKVYIEGYLKYTSFVSEPVAI